MSSNRNTMLTLLASENADKKLLKFEEMTLFIML